MNRKRSSQHLKKFSCVINTKGFHAGEDKYIGISVYHKEFIDEINKLANNV
ncbi:MULTISPECIES: hypothetical protein [unclassified Thermococcus]|uniref:hypothetical protein n=1 Tax=unclassified Thermococcus TaxID=2627626 RepID=UPI00143980C1|nr:MULTISPECIES: hypothetical protein [unclassified Thermococcus]